jgi:hypothetical protein
MNQLDGHVNIFQVLSSNLLQSYNVKKFDTVRIAGIGGL